jgi:hypothetical protein
MSDVVPWRRGQFRIEGKEILEADKGRFPVRQCGIGSTITQREAASACIKPASTWEIAAMSFNGV